MYKPLLSVLLFLSAFGYASSPRHMHLHNKVGARSLELARDGTQKVHQGFKTVGYYVKYILATIATHSESYANKTTAGPSTAATFLPRTSKQQN